MLVLLRNFLRDLLWHPDAARGYLRGFTNALATLATTAAAIITTLPSDQLETLLSQPKKLALLVAPSLIAVFAGLVRAGDRTPKDVLAMAEKAKNGD